jgi:hypothetical protein
MGNIPAVILKISLPSTLRHAIPGVVDRKGHMAMASASLVAPSPWDSAALGCSRAQDSLAN